MTTMARVVPVLACAWLLSGCPGNPEPEDPEWHVVLENLPGAVLSMWGPSTNDLFAVGGPIMTGGGQAQILWHDGTDWWDMSPPSTPSLWWVFGFGHDDVWAVGEQGTVLRFNGSAWTELDSGRAYTLWGIWGATPDDVWAVGGNILDRSVPGVIRHWDGAMWSDATGVDTTGQMFFKVWGTATDDVYVVGDSGTILHYDGSAWTFQESGTTQRLLTLHGRAADDIWAVGGYSGAVLLHNDGTGWSQVTLETEALQGVWTAPGQPVLTAGLNGLVVLGSAGEREWRIQDTITVECLHAAWGDDSGAMAVSGGNLWATDPLGVIVGSGAIRGGTVRPWTGP